MLARGGVKANRLQFNMWTPATAEGSTRLTNCATAIKGLVGLYLCAEPSGFSPGFPSTSPSRVRARANREAPSLGLHGPQGEISTQRYRELAPRFRPSNSGFVDPGLWKRIFPGQRSVERLQYVGRLVGLCADCGRLPFLGIHPSYPARAWFRSVRV